MRRVAQLAAVAVLAAVAASPAAAASQPLAYSDYLGNAYLSTTAGGSGTTLFTATSTEQLSTLSISPDGSQVLVLDSNGSTQQLALVPAGGGSPTDISGTTGASDGSFTPDGKSVVFSVSGSGTLAAGVYTIAVGGGTAAQVVATPSGDTDSLAVVSPDGTEVAFARDVPGSSGNDTVSLELAPLAGGSPTALATGLSGTLAVGGRIAFSPDGKTLAYVGDGTAPGIYSVPTAGGSSTRLTQDYDAWPVYTSDGSLLFARDATSSGADDNAASPKAPVSSDIYELWAMQANGSGAAVVAEGDYSYLAVQPQSTASSTGSGTSTGTGGTSTGTGSTSSTGSTASTGSTSSGGSEPTSAGGAATGSSSGSSSSTGGGASSSTGGAGSTTTAGGSGDGSPSTVSTPASGVHVAVKGTLYTVTWRGTAPMWQIVLTVGKTSVTHLVSGSIHISMFIIRGAGTPDATVTPTTSS